MSNMKLWYNHPGTKWSQGLPIGNGRIGAVIYGGTDAETWSVNEVTFWSGQSEPAVSESNGKADLQAMREHFFAGDYAAGDRLAKQMLQPRKQNYGTNLPLMDVLFRFTASGKAEQFSRELRLEQAVYQAFYNVNGKKIMREVFATHADHIVAARLWGEESGSISFQLGVAGRTASFAAEIVNEDTIAFRCQATEQVHSNGTCGVWSEGLIKLITSGGSLREEAGQLIVTDADEAWVYLAVNTDYRAEDGEWMQVCSNQIERAIARGYDALRADHIQDYRQLYSKVTIQLGESGHASLPTDERLRLLKTGQADDPELFALFLQYGRYLMIAGSREDSPLPLHLQGIWNDGEACRMGWSCDYHLDTNTQMNYYPVEVTNLGECHLPLMRYIEALSQAGRSAARDFYGSEGWVAHVFSNAWGFTAPGWETSWGLNVTGGLWIATHLMERYAYSLDQDFLAQRAYPVLKEAAEFFLDYMTVHPKRGWLVTGPSNSPENHFYIDDRSQGVQQLSMGSTLDQVLVRELFTFCLDAADRLQTDHAFQQQVREAIAVLPPLQIGKNGQLQEWLEDYEEAQPEHRHLSHLVALYPAHQITPEGTPELSEAARVSLERRMAQDELEDIEFTAALFGLYFARLQDGEKAYRHVSHLIGSLCFENLLSYSIPGIAGAETNIFVIDGNFGGTAAMAEMLLQSQMGSIHVLPALPKAWESGTVTGLRARGNAEVDIEWKEHQLVRTTIYAYVAGNITVQYGDKKVSLDVEAGGVYRLDHALDALHE
ncbi:glycoside hydrolase N-terminal domain-containing protein [Paenibacillus sp. GCM10027629]|uniref:glycoside hydrolase family 95 protein n=1 Tax=Paenibacillus sp. GCM10027629 TaxID=3273414 RepID=UPI0036311EDF